MLALQWSDLRFVIEPDCLEAIDLLRKEDMDRSQYTLIVREIIQLMEQPNSRIIVEPAATL